MLLDKRFRELYVLILEFSNKGAVTVSIREGKTRDKSELDTKARAIINRAYHALAARCAPNTPFGWLVQTKRYPEINQVIDELSDDVNTFNNMATRRGSSRTILLRMFPATLVDRASYDRITLDIIERLRSARAQVERGDFHQYRLDAQKLQNIDNVLQSPFDYGFNSVTREIRNNRDTLFDATKSPPRPSEIPAEYRDAFRLNPASVLGQFLEWPQFDKYVKQLEDTCSSD